MADEGMAEPSSKRIVIIDDDESVRDLLVFIVQKEGFQFDTASDGLGGVGKVRQLMPDLVLLDLMLPGQGGYEALRQLQEGETSRIPIVVITGRHADPTTVSMIRQEPNVADFLQKPLKHMELGNLLHRVLRTKPKDKR